MKWLLLLVLGCGDNIHPDARPDARVYYPPPLIDPGKPGDPVGVDPGESVPPPPLTDAGAAPDAAPCDRHVDINGHEHKCQHEEP